MEKASKQTLELSEELNCRNSSNIEVLSCLQSIDKSELSNSLDKYRTIMVKGDKLFPKETDELAAENSFKKCNIITGFNSDEFGYYISLVINSTEMENLNFNQFEKYLKIFRNYGFEKSKVDADLIYERYFGTRKPQELNQSSINYGNALIQINSDPYFVCQAFQMAEIQSKFSNRAYVYEYKYRNPASLIDEVYGTAVHAEELGMTFGIPLNDQFPGYPGFVSPYNYSSETKLVAERILSYWTNFIKHDDPNSGSEYAADYWKPFIDDTVSIDKLNASQKMNTGRFLLIEDKIKMRTGFSSHQCDLWKFISNSGVTISVFKYILITSFILAFLNM